MNQRYVGKTVVVTGGSAGLGWHLACAFAAEGARVYILARDADRLNAAVERASTTNPLYGVLVADVTSDEQVDAAMLRVAQECGRLDVLVNAAGVSHRGAVVDTTPEQFQHLWELNFLGLVRCVRAAATHAELLRRGTSIVNIGSLASKIASPYLGAYPASKFAVAAYSQQLRMEWEPQGVHVLLACPGPLRRDDAGKRYDAIAADLPEAARRPGGGAQLNLLDPQVFSRQVVQACVDKRLELVVPGKIRLLTALAQFFPRWADRTIRRKTTGT
ncbi:MAG: SDR family oxidoreductase [Planctomycetales bacterium]|nr:SDR family oxidoreductase [Planctomycetales bacterium]MCA9170017.1 SDR family oxidoreductase [Planctomycetales bacterium]